MEILIDLHQDKRNLLVHLELALMKNKMIFQMKNLCWQMMFQQHKISMKMNVNDEQTNLQNDLNRTMTLMNMNKLEKWMILHKIPLR